MVVTTHIFLFEYMKFGWSKLIWVVSVKYTSDFDYIVWKIKNVHLFNNFYINNILKYFRYLKYIVQINFIASFYFNVVTTKFKTRYVSTTYVFLQVEEQHVLRLWVLKDLVLLRKWKTTQYLGALWQGRECIKGQE